MRSQNDVFSTKPRFLGRCKMALLSGPANHLLTYQSGFSSCLEAVDQYTPRCFRLRSSLHSFPSHETSWVAGWAACMTPKTGIVPISKHVLGDLPVNSARSSRFASPSRRACPDGNGNPPAAEPPSQGTSRENKLVASFITQSRGKSTGGRVSFVDFLACQYSNLSTC